MSAPTTIRGKRDVDGKGARAFGSGIDARMTGKPLTANPCRPSSPEYYAWIDGWKEAERFYACEVNGRWPHLRRKEIGGF